MWISLDDHHNDQSYQPSRDMFGLHYLLGLLTVAIVAGVSDARSPQRIRGGTEVALGEFPYQVSIRIRGHHICGGSIIGKRWVVTAAHCVGRVLKPPHADLRVATGTIFSFGGQTHPVKSVIAHDKYNTSVVSSPNDIAVIELASDLVFSKTVNKVNLPTAEPINGLEANATGWGLESSAHRGPSYKLRKVVLHTLGFKECQKHFGRLTLFRHHICTHTGTGFGVCQGDSGGPLVHKGELIGTVSFGVPCGRGFPDVYTNMYHYKDWIKKHTNVF